MEPGVCSLWRCQNVKKNVAFKFQVVHLVCKHKQYLTCIAQGMNAISILTADWIETSQNLQATNTSSHRFTVSFFGDYGQIYYKTDFWSTTIYKSALCHQITIFLIGSWHYYWVSFSFQSIVVLWTPRWTLRTHLSPSLSIRSSCIVVFLASGGCWWKLVSCFTQDGSLKIKRIPVLVFVTTFLRLHPRKPEFWS